MSNTLEDSGGHYYDADSPGPVGIARRNIRAAMAEVTSGGAGAAAIGLTIGFVVAGIASRWID